MDLALAVVPGTDDVQIIGCKSMRDNLGIDVMSTRNDNVGRDGQVEMMPSEDVVMAAGVSKKEQLDEERLSKLGQVTDERVRIAPVGEALPEAQENIRGTPITLGATVSMGPSEACSRNRCWRVRTTRLGGGQNDWFGPDDGEAAEQIGSGHVQARVNGQAISRCRTVEAKDGGIIFERGDSGYQVERVPGAAGVDGRAHDRHMEYDVGETSGGMRTPRLWNESVQLSYQRPAGWRAFMLEAGYQ